MPTKEPIPAEPPAPELLLGAIDRADRHRRNTDNPGASVANIKEHLGLPHNGATTIRLRPIWQNLEADGLIEQTRHRSHHYWRLTPSGHRHLAAAQDASGLYQLPESPQHERWRETHAAAGQRIGEFQDDLREAIGEVAWLLDADRQPESGEWYAIGEKLKRICERVGSATHCLYEWPEPDDMSADIDEPPFGQRARREMGHWDEPETRRSHSRSDAMAS